MPKDDWTQLGNPEKIKRLTKVLTRAGADLKYRDRCLVSSHSARDAVEEEGNVTFPDGMEVRFINDKEAERRLVLKLPDYIDPHGGPWTPVQADQKSVPCTYIIYAPPGPQPTA